MDAGLLEAARLGFHCAFPHRSAKRRFYITQIAAFALVLTAIAVGWRSAPAASFGVLHISALAFFGAAIAWRLVAASSLSADPPRLPMFNHWPTYTILCPIYREANVINDLVKSLRALDYPRHALDVKILVEQDDAETVEAAMLAVNGTDFEVVVIPPAKPRTKPKALNVGLALARGDFLVVYDAEDRPHPLQLRAALGAFEAGGERLACVQAPLDIDNPEASWITRQFAVEYAIQFTQILPLLGRLNMPLPLGGSSNHFRTDILRASGGWDPFNVTEDADLGYRLARDGWRSGVIAAPTWEEAPVSFSMWFNQRTRWLKGHMQTRTDARPTEDGA